MIKKIAISLLLLCLFIAIPLAILGVKRIELGGAFIKFMDMVDSDFVKWKVDIPNIPTFEPAEKENGWTLLLNFVIHVYNFFVTIVNGGITLMNIIIQVIQFLCTVIYEIGKLIAIGEDIGDSEYEWAWSSYQPYS